MITQPWYPSNSSDGHAFEANVCTHCAGFFGGYCRVLLKAMANGESDKWVQDDEGARCLSFKERGTRTLRKPRNPGGRQLCLL